MCVFHCVFVYLLCRMYVFLNLILCVLKCMSVYVKHDQELTGSVYVLCVCISVCDVCACVHLFCVYGIKYISSVYVFVYKYVRVFVCVHFILGVLKCMMCMFCVCQTCPRISWQKISRLFFVPRGRDIFLGKRQFSKYLQINNFFCGTTLINTRQVNGWQTNNRQTIFILNVGNFFYFLTFLTTSFTISLKSQHNVF